MSVPKGSIDLQEKLTKRRMKISKMLRKAKKRLARPIRYVSMAIYFLPSIPVYLLGFRFLVNTFPDRIGHLVAEFDCFLKEMDLGIRPVVRPVVLLSADDVANDCMLEYWETRIRAVRGRFFQALLSPFLFFPYLRITLTEVVTAFGETADYPAVQARWGSRPPLLELSEDHRRRGEEGLRKMGIPEGAWFVCVHSREGGYSPGDEHLQSFRNSAIADYVPAMRAIVDRGGWCVRMGDPTMTTMDPMPGVFDYAKSNLKSDWMDIFLCARARFFLGNTSGLCLVSSLFGVPSALANMAPISAAYPTGFSDIGIPMLTRRVSGEVMHFRELLDSPMANLRFTPDFVENELEPIPNSPEEIKDLAIEMLDRLDGSLHVDERAEQLQTIFRSFFREGHYTYGAASRMGSAFLTKYAHLLEDEAVSG